MSTDNGHIFDKYIVQGETTRRQRAENWQIAIGLQDVDRLKNSRYLLNTAKEHIEGRIDLAAAEERIAEYYRTEEGRKLAADRTDEADIVATRIAAVLSEDAFSFIPEVYSCLHKRLFKGVYPHAGKYRKVNISKKEWVLDGESVIYAPADLLKETLEYDFSQERRFSYYGLSPQESVRHICKFISGFWQIHPFMEGNTRTTAVFTILYLRKFGFQVSNEPFKEYSWYFRNALVRANYNNFAHGIVSTTVYLERFFENLIFQGKNELKNRFCHILWKEGQSAQSAISKCHDGTLEKAALVFLRNNPKATQKMLAEQIGKSERTAKRLTKTLQEKGLLVRKNGRRNGVWEVIQPSPDAKSRRKPIVRGAF